MRNEAKTVKFSWYLTCALAAMLAHCAASAAASGTNPGTATDSQVRQAASLLQSGKMAEAEKLLLTVLRTTPQNAQALNLLGIVRGEQNRMEEAEKLFQRALAADPRLGGAAVNLGYLYKKMDRREEALSAFTRAARIQQNDPEVQFNIALLEAESGNLGGAVAILERIPRGSRPPAYFLVLARAYLGLARFQELERIIPETAEALAPFPKLIGDFAQLLSSTPLKDQVIGFLEHIPPQAAESFPVQFHLAEAYQARNDLERAGEHYRKALALQPKSVETLMRLSVVLQRQEKWEEMLRYLSQAKELAPNSGAVLYGFALAAMRTERLGDAHISIQQALSLEPDNPDYLFLYGVTQISSADVPGATETFTRYATLRPEDARGQLSLGSALYSAARYDEALASLNKSLELSSGLVEPWYYIGMIKLRQGERQKAVELLHNVIVKEPNHAAAHAGMGAAYFELGEMEKARQELETALKLNPEHATTHYQLSQVLVRLNQPERAQEELKLYKEMKEKAQEASSAASRLMQDRK